MWKVGQDFAPPTPPQLNTPCLTCQPSPSSHLACLSHHLPAARRALPFSLIPPRRPWGPPGRRPHFTRDTTGTALQIVPLALAGCAMVWLACSAKGSDRDCKTAKLVAAAVLVVGVAHVVVQALGVRSWYPDTIERVEGARRKLLVDVASFA